MMGGHDDPTGAGEIARASREALSAALVSAGISDSPMVEALGCLWEDAGHFFAFLDLAWPFPTEGGQSAEGRPHSRKRQKRNPRAPRLGRAVGKVFAARRALADDDTEAAAAYLDEAMVGLALGAFLAARVHGRVTLATKGVAVLVAYLRSRFFAQDVLRAANGRAVPSDPRKRGMLSERQAFEFATHLIRFSTPGVEVAGSEKETNDCYRQPYAKPGQRRDVDRLFAALLLSHADAAAFELYQGDLVGFLLDR